MKTRQIVFGATLIATGASAAMAQPVATYDPRQLPETKGQIAQYSLTPRGDVDGVILRDGTQVHLPPHLGAQLVEAVKPDDAVTIRGLKAQALPLIQAVSIRDDVSGKVVVDTGPPAMPPQPVDMPCQWQQVQGQVKEPLFGPRGEMNGALLEDGTQVHLPPDQAWTLRKDLQAGQTLVAKGYGVKGAYGRSIDAQQIGDTASQLVQVGPPGPPGPLPPFGGPGLGPAAPPPPGFGTPPPPPPGGPGAPPPRG